MANISLTKIIFLLFNIYLVFSTTYEATTNSEIDPEPNGGAPCNDDLECGGLDGGVCFLYITNSTEVTGSHAGYCVCYEDRGDPDCTYKRHNGDLAGGLQFIYFAGVGGIGNFYIGRTGAGAGQLILGLAYMFACVFGCVAGCCACCGSSSVEIRGGIVMGIGGCLILCAVLAGFIWAMIDADAMFNGHYSTGTPMVDGNGYALY